MRGKRKGENDRAQSRLNKLKEFWSKRPLSMWTSNSKNKKLCRRIERRTTKQAKLDQED